MTARSEEPVVLPARFPEPAGQRRRPASPSAWRPASRRTTSASCATRWSHLIKHPRATVEELVDAACRGRISRPAACWSSRATRSREAYETGRGSFRLRARWEVEELRPRRLSDRRHRNSLSGAEIAADRAHRRSCSRNASCRCSATCAMNRPRRCGSCWSPRRATSSPPVLMESLFRATELEMRIPLNLNVLDAHRRAARDESEGGAAGLPRSSPRGAAAPRALPPRRDRAAQRNPARLDDRLSQSRRGHPHHPRGRRRQRRG